MVPILAILRVSDAGIRTMRTLAWPGAIPAFYGERIANRLSAFNSSSGSCILIDEGYAGLTGEHHSEG